MACTGSIPTGATEIAFPAETGTLRYREEIRHPALPFPKIATGTLQVGQQGRLIRSQETPDVEIFEIGEDVVWVRKSEGGEANMLPIPGHMQTLFDVLRALRAGETLIVPADAARNEDSEGWVGQIATFDESGSVSVIACQDRLLGYVVRSDDGIERRVLFESNVGTTE